MAQRNQNSNGGGARVNDPQEKLSTDAAAYTLASNLTWGTELQHHLLRNYSKFEKIWKMMKPFCKILAKCRAPVEKFDKFEIFEIILGDIWPNEEDESVLPRSENCREHLTT